MPRSSLVGVDLTPGFDQISRDTLDRMGRRRNQRPILTPSPTGGWMIRYRQYSQSGAPVNKRKYFDNMNKRQAQTAADEFMATINRPDRDLPSQTVFGRIANSYLTDPGKLVPESKLAYTGIYKNHIEKRWADVRVCDIHPIDIEAWIREIGPNMREAFLRNVLGLFSRIWTEAMILGATDRANPIELLRKRRRGVGKANAEREKRIPTEDQINAIFCALEPAERLMVQIMVFTGLRSCEALALTWNDMTKDSVVIDKIVVQLTNRVALKRVKRSASFRVIPIAHFRHMIVRPDGVSGDERIYPERYWNLQKRLRAAAKSIGLAFEGFGCHSMRRWFTTQFRVIGNDTELAMRQLGHATAAMSDLYMMDARLEKRAELAAKVTAKVRVM